MLPFFAGLPRCVVVMEACAGAHHGARELRAQGHEPRPPYVKPFVKRRGAILSHRAMLDVGS
jgi:transposase